ncbi:MAG: hypothetical protein GTN76_12110 [Candidatus Aenigmarchaeota archaeon]|nr:hypothetical protein [Candidatus Aenigmarchaeota archaeon]
MTKELVLNIEYSSTKIFQNEKDYLKSCRGLARFTDTGLVYLDDIGKQIQTASKKSKIKSVKKDVVVKEDGVITQLIVKYKGEVPTIPSDLREKLQVHPLNE